MFCVFKYVIDFYNLVKVFLYGGRLVKWFNKDDKKCRFFVF